MYMFTHKHICIYIYTHTYLYIHTYVYIHICIYTHSAHTNIYIYMTDMYLHVYTYSA